MERSTQNMMIAHFVTVMVTLLLRIAMSISLSTEAAALFRLRPQTQFRVENLTLVQYLFRGSSTLWEDPESEDLKEYELTKILGNDVNFSHISIEKPKDFSKIDDGDVTEDELLRTMPKDLKSTEFHLASPERSRSPRSRSRELFRLWLWNMSYCPVRYKWKDLGKYFWPRYLKFGYCKEKVCSYPAGMSCKPSKASEQVKLLSWTCHSKVRKKGKQCGWITIIYSIVDKCSCSCTKD